MDIRFYNDLLCRHWKTRYFVLFGQVLCQLTDRGEMPNGMVGTLTTNRFMVHAGGGASRICAIRDQKF